MTFITIRKLKISTENLKMNLLDDENVYSEDESDENTLWENPHVQDLAKYPEPFSGKDENVYDFIERVETAFYYNRVREADKVNVVFVPIYWRAQIFLCDENEGQC